MKQIFSAWSDHDTTTETESEGASSFDPRKESRPHETQSGVTAERDAESLDEGVRKVTVHLSHCRASSLIKYYC